MNVGISFIKKFNEGLIKVPFEAFEKSLSGFFDALCINKCFLHSER